MFSGHLSRSVDLVRLESCVPVGLRAAQGQTGRSVQRTSEVSQPKDNKEKKTGQIEKEFLRSVNSVF